jgi:DNA polymerase
MPARPGRPAAAAALGRLKREAAGCRACGLWKRGTQTVFGAGPPGARVMLVGEQPGDQEDLVGEPFVGPAGRILRQALEQAGLAERDVYLTNAVKHFKWRQQGKRRIHERPNREEILACRPWLEGEIAAVKPRVIVALGATAAATLVGPRVRVTRDRGRPVESPLADRVTVTVHPSSILRAPDSATRREALRLFVADLKAIARWLASG